MRTAFLVLILLGGSWSASSQWISMPDGPDYRVRALSFDSINSRLYAFGRFTQAGGQVVNGTAFYEDGQWLPMGEGSTNAFVFGVIAAYHQNDSVMISGSFSSMVGVPNTYRIALWNGTEWQSIGGMGMGMNEAVFGMLANEDGWTMASGFTEIGGIASHGIARYHNGEWEDLCSYPDNSGHRAYSALAEYQGQYIVGGNINDFPEINEIGVLINDTLRPMGTGILGDSWVNDMVVYDGKLFVAGEFYAGWGNPGSGIMTWDGENWTDPVPGIQYIAQGHDLDVYDGKLFIAGTCIIPGTPGYYTLAMYTPGEICLFGKNLNAVMSPIAATDTFLYVAPNTPTLVANGEALNWLAKYDLSQGFDTCIILATSVSAITMEKPGLQIYPNPGEGVFSIALPAELEGQFSLSVHDAIGKLKYNELRTVRSGGSIMPLDLNGLEAGIYMVRLRPLDGSAERTAKLILQ